MGAQISQDQCFRYRLIRVWDEALPEVAFILLNPSTADSNTDDSTVKRCVGYAKNWGYGSLSIYNLYAYRATDSRDLKKQGYPIGEEYDAILRDLELSNIDIIAAWGDGDQLARVVKVMELIHRPVQCLAYNKNGMLHHPLRLPKDIHPKRWDMQAIL